LKRLILILFVLLCFTEVVSAQTNTIRIKAFLDLSKGEISIEQNTTYFNTSATNLDTIYFHNWANSFRNRKSTLSERLIEDYDKSLYFSRRKDRGRSEVKNMSENYQYVEWHGVPGSIDILKVVLNKTLSPGESTTIATSYVVKIPKDTFTRYGKNGNIYNLRYWHLVPVVYDGQWSTMNNLNMDDFYMEPTNYDIEFKLPEGVNLNTDLNHVKTSLPPYSTHKLTGKERVDVELNVTVFNDFKRFQTDSIEVISNLNGTNLRDGIRTDVINRQLSFINEHLGPYPHEKILINQISYFKNPIYGLNQLPKLFNPFSGVFEWDIKMFKVLTKKYLENTLLVNRRNDYWLINGIQTYLMMQYVEKYYPEIKAMGNVSKIWGVRNYSIAKLDFNGKYPFVYQFAARTNLDQSLTTRADSLSNFNRKIVNKYKAGIGLRYLDEYLKDSIISKSIRSYYDKNALKLAHSKDFESIVIQNSEKDVSWFFGDYLNSKKKIDYTIKKVVKNDDSIAVTIKNKRNFTAPIALYGVNKKDIIFKKWLPAIDSTSTIKIPTGDFTRLSLNYEYLYPELNLRNNWKNLKGIFNKPIQFRFFKDIENPYYNQVFYNVYSDYNFYDGLLLGPRIYNEAIFKKKWLYKITPTYGLKSNKISGSFSLLYEQLPEETKIYRYRFGFGGSTFQYAPDLSYTRFTPFASIQFKRKSLRDVGGKSLVARYVLVDRETAPNTATLESDSYNIFNVRLISSKPDIIKDIRYLADFQLSKNFSKLAFDFRYRRLTDTNRQYDFRLFAGTFLHNRVTDSGDFFSFSLDRPSDYLFDYSYLGRSEEAGFLSQQIIISEGGFKSQFTNRFANQWMLTTNGSVSIWRWIEAYVDAGYYKSNNQDIQFKYDTGIRLNLVHNILEIYFPLQSSLGFEPSLKNYDQKIRFVLTLDPGAIINFVKRGFF